MKVEITHSIVQDMTVVKFNKLSDYFRTIEYFDSQNLSWIPVKYSSTNDTASIRLSEPVLKVFCKKYGVLHANTNHYAGLTGMR